MSVKQITAIAIFIIVVIIGAIFAFNSFEHNETQNWQIVQAPGGSVRVQDDAGYYMSNFANVYTWPRARQMEWGKEKGEEIRVTFNDGGTARLTGSIRYRLPVKSEDRIRLHKEFNGSVDNVDRAVFSHLVNCIKVSGPVMSSSENQSARKAEFNFLVHEQLQKGLFESRKIEQILKDKTDEKGEPITVFATEIVKNDQGLPVIQQPSPLMEYGIEVVQFSIEETNYDDTTLKQFEAKKGAFLAAEKSKAEREQEVQQRLMIIEKGLRERAEVEAEANKDKAKLVIEADRAVEVAKKEKEQATVVAEREVAIAEQQAKQQEQIAAKAVLEAKMFKDVAAQKLEAAKLDAESIKVKALAEADRLKIGGAISEEKKVLAEIARDRDIQVADKLSKINTPSVIFGGGQNGHTDMQSSLMNLWMLRSMGIIPEIKVQQ